MCGIIGVFGDKNSRKLVQKELELINNRGRDGKFFIRLDNDSSVGHCLHAVVGKLKQPLKAKGIFLANCEIYNWKELSSEYLIKSENDADLFFKLIEKIGLEETLELVDGDYAGCYIINNKLYLFKDLLGVKPLWYSFNKKFVFASEKKVLENLGCEKIYDLSPRMILIYNIKNSKLTFINRKFIELNKNEKEYPIIKKETLGLLINAISKRIPDSKFGVMFSGGIDSVFITLILKQLRVKFNCYTCIVEDGNFNKAEDLIYSEKIAKELGLKLKIIKVQLKDIKKALKIVPITIESNNVTKVSVALPFYFISKKAKEDGCKVLMSGLGSEEIFAGYERHKRSLDINKECYSGLLWLYERDLYRDDVITMYNSVELRVPFLDLTLVKYVLNIDQKYKINNENNKIILREIAFGLGLKKEYAYRKKRAAQYGGNFDKAIDKLARLENAKSKSEYLYKYYHKPNLKLGVLYSGGKDSNYSMYIMQKQNYEIKCLISLKSLNKDSYMFHTPNIDFVKYQSEALEIPILIQETKGEKENELEDMKNILLKAKEKYGLQGIVTGALYSNYQRDRIEKICDSIGLKVFSPLWHKEQLQELKEIINEGFEVIIIRIAADGLNKNWLGRKLDFKAVEELERLYLKNGLNIAGEGGEFETFVLNGPNFKKIIHIEKSKIKMESENCGDLIIEKIGLKDK